MHKTPIHAYIKQLETDIDNLMTLLKSAERVNAEEVAKNLESIINDGRRWISVKERLPENEVSVIAFCTEDNHAWYAFRRGGLWWRPGDRVSIKIFGTVTHWMPLPEPPKEE